MYRSKTVGVVVPSYNEERFVGDVIETIPSYVDRIYAVDDASTDRTWEVITRCVRAENGDVAAETSGLEFDRRVVPIRHETNRGVGGAIKSGYRQARTDGVDVVAVMAGDGQMDPDELDRLLDPIVDGAAEYAVGNRLHDRKRPDGMSTWRLTGNVILTFLTRIASGYWDLSDPQNGYTAISGEALDAVDIDDLYEDYGFCNDLLVRLNVQGMTVTGVSMPAKYGEETSYIRYHTFIPKLSLLLTRRFGWRIRKKYLSGGAAKPDATPTGDTVLSRDD